MNLRLWIDYIIGRFIEWLVIRVLARWFPSRYRLIPRLDGKPMLRQFKITNWCYLQSFLIAETEEMFHVHRWRKMYSIVLAGAFMEERYPGRIYKIHMAPSFYSMDDTVIHRFAGVLPYTWTLFFMFKNKERWGYYPRPADAGGYVEWDQAIKPENRVESL